MKTGNLIFGAGLLIIFSSTIMSNYFDDLPESTKGIQFFKGTWKEAINKAKNENKPIFLDIYATWCGPCKMLKRNTFRDKAVGQYFNLNYINVSVDGETEEGRYLMAKYVLHSYPSLLVIGNDENVIATASGYHSPDRLMEFGKLSIEKASIKNEIEYQPAAH